MESARLKRILTIVDHAISLKPEKRPGYLTEVCGEDVALRTEVLDLLKSIDKSEEFWLGWQDWNEQQIQQFFEEESKREELETNRAGPWNLLKLLGHGGMGKVFLAERGDGLYEQQAAVKILLRGLEYGDSLQRFEQERQILAKLDHPNIASLYDGGITEDGRPWLAMQYVDGIPITEWCKEQNCTLQERLNLFKKVCVAVRYAHTNLIVHRDLKPDNILVSKEGEVKILDFGIAKLINDELTESRRIETQTGFRVMSLDYAAPEQVVGESVTTATDVYALGLLLYEMLTDSYPFDLQKKNQRQIEQTIRNEDPLKPSSVTDRWKNKLKGDLDAIILKALRKEPDQRYENAGQMLYDINRQQSHLPVHAQRDTFRYRTAKFYKRHRSAMFAGAAVFAGVCVLVLYYTTRIIEERNRAQEEAVKAQEISTFLEDLFNASDPFIAAETGRPDTMEVRSFLTRGADRIQTELQDQPLVQARMLNVVGDVYYNLGLFDDALPLLDQSRNIRMRTGSPLELAQVHESIARVQQSKGDLNGAENSYRTALELFKNEGNQASRKLSAIRVKLAMLLTDKSEYEESESLLSEALFHQKSSFGEKDPDVAETLRSFGILFHRQSDLDRAEVYYQEALALNRELYGDEHLDVVQNLFNLSTLMREKGEYNSAGATMYEVLEIQKAILGEEHPNTITTMYELAILLRDKQDPKLQEAVDLFREVIEMDKKQRGEIHHYVGLDLIELGVTLNKMLAYNEATEVFRESISILRKALPEGHPDIAMALIGLGDVLVRVDKPAEAEPFLAEGLEIRKDKFGEDAWRTGVSKSALGWAIMMQKRYDEAEPLLLEGYYTLHKNNGPTRAAIGRLVMLYERKGQNDKADEYQNLLSQARY